MGYRPLVVPDRFPLVCPPGLPGDHAVLRLWGDCLLGTAYLNVGGVLYFASMVSGELATWESALGGDSLPPGGWAGVIPDGVYGGYIASLVGARVWTGWVALCGGTVSPGLVHLA